MYNKEIKRSFKLNLQKDGTMQEIEFTYTIDPEESIIMIYYEEEPISNKGFSIYVDIYRLLLLDKEDVLNEIIAKEYSKYAEKYWYNKYPAVYLPCGIIKMGCNNDYRIKFAINQDRESDDNDHYKYLKIKGAESNYNYKNIEVNIESEWLSKFKNADNIKSALAKPDIYCYLEDQVTKRFENSVSLRDSNIVIYLKFKDTIVGIRIYDIMNNPFIIDYFNKNIGDDNNILFDPAKFLTEYDKESYKTLVKEYSEKVIEAYVKNSSYFEDDKIYNRLIIRKESSIMSDIFNQYNYDIKLALSWKEYSYITVSLNDNYKSNIIYMQAIRTKDIPKYFKTVESIFDFVIVLKEEGYQYILNIMNTIKNNLGFRVDDYIFSKLGKNTKVADNYLDRKIEYINKMTTSYRISKTSAEVIFMYKSSNGEIGKGIQKFKGDDLINRIFEFLSDNTLNIIDPKSK